MSRFQAKFTTKNEKYSIGDTVIELEDSLDRNRLNDLLRSLLKQSGELTDDDLNGKTFEFVVAGKFLRSTISAHFNIYKDEINEVEYFKEKLVEIEYLLPPNEPRPSGAVEHGDWVSGVDASETYLASCHYGGDISIFSLKDRKLILNQDATHKGLPVNKIRFIGNTNRSNKNELYLVSCGHDEMAKLWKFDSKSRKLTTVLGLAGHRRSVQALDIKDDLLATGSFDKSVRIWSINTELSKDELAQSRTATESLDDSGETIPGNKRRKVCSNDKFQPETVFPRRTAMMTLTEHLDSVTGIKWLDETQEPNCVASCSIDGCVAFNDLETGKCKRLLRSTKALLCIDFNKERNLVFAGCADRYIRGWDARAPQNSPATMAFSSHNGWVSCLKFGTRSPDLFVSGGYDNMVKLWDLRSPNACLYDLIGHHDKVMDVSWSNPDYVVSGSSDTTMKIFAMDK